MNIKALSAAFAAAALGLAATAIATPAAAEIVLFAKFDTGTSTANNFRFVNAGASNPDTATLYTTATASATSAGAAATRFTFTNDPALSGFVNLSSLLTFTATVTDKPAGYDGSTYTQSGINGNLKFVYHGPTTNINGFHLIKDVSILLQGTFHDAWIQGSGGVGGLDVTIANGGNANLTSAYYDLSQFAPGTQEFTFHLGSITPSLGRANANSALRSFRGHVGGEFQAQAVPEAGTWALMIVGFGGAGAMLRRGRRALAQA